MMQEKVLAGIPDLRIVVFQWAMTHGECDECGLPAAFTTVTVPGRNLCAVCAASAAADGEEIMRLEDDLVEVPPDDDENAQPAPEEIRAGILDDNVSLPEYLNRLRKNGGTQ